VAYYKASLLYLACINIDEQTKEDLVSRAHDLSIAALLGETIYNFGELVSPGIQYTDLADNNGSRAIASTSATQRSGRLATQMAERPVVRVQRGRYRTVRSPEPTSTRRGTYPPSFSAIFAYRLRSRSSTTTKISSDKRSA
jgi:hypothetical protein